MVVLFKIKKKEKKKIRNKKVLTFVDLNCYNALNQMIQFNYLKLINASRALMVFFF